MTPDKKRMTARLVKDEKHRNYFDLFVNGKKTNATVQVFPHFDGCVDVEIGIFSEKKLSFVYRKVRFD